MLPGGSPAELLELVQWPRAKAVLVIGHQPMLGQTIAHLVGLKETECAVRKGAVWWRSQQRLEETQTVIVTVQSPEVL